VLPSRLVSALDQLEPAAFGGEAYRHQAAAWHPLSGAGARTQGGRWNPPQSFATLYLALDRETVIAEFLRMAKRSGRAPQDFLPRSLYRYQVELRALVDLRGADAREALELTDSALVSEDLSRCQAVGEAAQYLGREGILAPSAARAGTVLAVFIDRLQPGSVIRDIDYETWEPPPEPAQNPESS
jgi:RES domain-containing protein